MNHYLEIVCAWCGKHLGRKPNHKPGVSHGICPHCFKKQTADLSNLSQQFAKAQPSSALRLPAMQAV